MMAETETTPISSEFEAYISWSRKAFFKEKVLKYTNTNLNIKVNIQDENRNHTLSLES